MCVDFRALNSITENDPYQMPRIDDILDSLAEAHFISKIDLNKGFHLVLPQKTSVKQHLYVHGHLCGHALCC